MSNHEEFVFVILDSFFRNTLQMVHQLDEPPDQIARQENRHIRDAVELAIVFLAR